MRDARISLASLASLAAAIGVHACTAEEPAAAVMTTVSTGCIEESTLTADQQAGASLPPRTLALTFDDGPSARTIELATYLQSEGIAAAFFVNGMWVLAQPGALAQLVARGHLVANHAQEHLDMSSYSVFPATPAGDAALITEVADTDALITPFVPNGRRIFRAPFGRWNARAQSVLNGSPMAGYVGPIGWDIGDYRSETTAADWACWQQEPALTAKACGDLFLGEIQEVGRGIVLLHDGAYGDVSNHALTTGVGNTFDMVKYMVPVLKAAGFSFVRVDNVPAIAAQLPPLPDVDAGTGPDAASMADATRPDAASPIPDAMVPSPPRPDDPCASRPRGGAGSTSHAH